MATSTISAGWKEVKSTTGATVAAHSAARPRAGQPRPQPLGAIWGETGGLPRHLLADGDVISLGGLLLTVRHTPRHSPEGICLFGPGLVFTGDLIFAGSVGRTDLPGGDLQTLVQSVKGDATAG